MAADRLFSGQAQIYFILFAGFALATLQNVTVDDAVLTGTCVPTYVPLSNWNQGSNCSICGVKPSASMAYNGTWHDTTFYPQGFTYLPTFEFTFVGNALYIFFILANNVTGARTFTDVKFILDGVQVFSYFHVPSTSTDFEYNQTVYANSSIPYGQHTMMVAPVNDSADAVLILFDYLIYTTEVNTSVTTSSTEIVVGTPVLTSSFQSPSPTSLGNRPTSSPPNVGAIVGGTVAGIGALVWATASVICYRRYKRRTSGSSPSQAMNVVEPFIIFPQVAPASSQNASLPIELASTGSPSTAPRPKYETAPNAPSAAVGSASEIIEQVGMLRNEVACLRRLQNLNRNTPALGTEPPPEYSLSAN